jgi:hypothetical protein
MNTLVTAGIALVVFAEWRDADAFKILLGTGCIILADILV